MNFLFIVDNLQKLITQPPSVSNNLCFFQGFGEVPDPSSCDHYYSCTNTRSIRMPCPADLFFRPLNSRSGICEYQSNVKCTGNGVRPGDTDTENNSNNSTTSTTTTTTSTTTTTTKETKKYH